MDPITHGITGSLLGNAFFSRGKNRVTWFAVVLGSVFPDIDIVPVILVELFSRDPLSVIKIHRGFTHSFVGLPIFAALLAAATRWWRIRRNRETPSWLVLFVAYAVGIASHLLLDAMTSYGTQLWTPLSHARVAWDLLFIIDFSFTGIVLLPQIVPWIHRAPERARFRAFVMWMVFSIAAFGVWKLTNALGFPFAIWGVAAWSAAIAALFFLSGKTSEDPRAVRAHWSRRGVLAMCVYFIAYGAAHHAALNRVETFVRERHLNAARVAAIPVPPTLLSWNGMVLTDEGVYQSRFDLRHAAGDFEMIPSSPPDAFIARARELPDVQTYFWFARFPVIRSFAEGDHHVVEFPDLRFFNRRGRRPTGFTFRVIFDSAGNPAEEEWAEGALGVRWKKSLAPEAKK
ncbi:MAG: metal-dependent hydrolase [Candidatus Acidiferrales bacterium]